jgi:VanZ family protein
MSKLFLKSWLPVFIWMAVIFCLSTDFGSARETGGLLEPLLRWFWPGVTHEVIEWCHFIVRKCGHLSEYALLAVLIWRAMEKPFLVKTHPCTLRIAGRAWLLAAAYAGTDEFHQAFVPSRTASIRDVAIDSFGALLGLLAIVGVQALRRRWTTSVP